MKTLILICSLLICGLSFGQYYYITEAGDTPGSINQDPAYPNGSGQESGWTSLLGPSVEPAEWSAIQSIPFPFNFNGNPVTEYKVSSTGVLTFSTSATAVPGPSSSALPNVNIPDNSICIWGLTASGTNDNVSTKTFGAAGSQQEWIHFSSCVNGTIGWSYWSIVLEEGSDHIYIVDQRNTSGDGALSVGLQIDATTAISDPASPNVDGTAGTSATSEDDFFYTFIYGTQAQNEVRLNSFDLLPYIGYGSVNFNGEIQNIGSEPITTLTISWDDGNGPYSDDITGLNILSDETYAFTSPTPLNAVGGQAYTIDLSVDIVGDVDSTNNDAEISTVSLTQIPTKYVVGEEKTGTWCGWCPRGAVGLANMESVSEFIGIAIHNGSNDPMVVTAYDDNIGTYIPGGYPRGGVDRVENGNPAAANFLAMHNERVEKIVPCEVKTLTAAHNSATNKINVSVESEWYGTIPGQYRFSCVIVEDDVLGEDNGFLQVNYYDGGANGSMAFPSGINNDFDFATGGDPADPYQFNGYDHVARYLSNNDILGNSGSLPSNEIPIGIHSYTFNPIPATFVDDINKSHAIVMIVNSETGEILNAQIAEIMSDADVTEMNNNFDIQLYPNPASEKLVVSFIIQNASNTRISISDVLGNEILSFDETINIEDGQQLDINTSMLSDGIYILSIHSGTSVSNKKFSISH
ncbi:T9SS type A sorting domain-containing protein [Crocinitomicaceae bacterium]|nr:T9SS type A sorting domain-containing protein [Crocinitomicaceae bacterium]